MNLPKLYLLRHGLATHSTTGYGDQILTAQLLPEGLPTVEKAAAFLSSHPTEVYFSSEVLRCQQTAAIVTQETGKTFTCDARLNEYHLDTPESFVSRIVDFLSEITHQNYTSVTLCTHGAVITVLASLAMDEKHPDPFSLNYPPPAGIWVIADGIIEKHHFD
ncbi:MAG TPA: phosphoglycerate mutase family protein [Vitreimonas sp.]|nr:phosphoglycerate mutase family protein [Vitreimonas sp.]